MSAIIWTLSDLTFMARKMQENKFDLIIAFCGSRGLSKSTLAYKLGLKLKFKPKRDLIYSRDELRKALNGWNRTINADEMINVAYKRDFFNMDQIELIKMLNMYRDHQNILMMCVPNFWDLDKPLRDLVKIRIDMLRRGFGAIHTQLKNFYSNDPWDSKNNEKIERGWNIRGILRPQYNRLSTFKGFIKFGKLSPKQEEKYQRIKNDKRAVLFEDKDIVDKDEADGFYKRTIEMLREGKIVREELEKICLVNKLKITNVATSINHRLANSGVKERFKELMNIAQAKRNENTVAEKKLELKPLLLPPISSK